MPRIAIKSLTASDLTLFEYHFRHHNAGNQKSINLNADIFIKTFYPQVPSAAATMDNEIPISLTLFGPGHRLAYKLARKITKLASYKNWRLNGEFIRNPEAEPERFNVLRPGDLAVMAFEGDLIPSALRISFLAQNLPEDATIRNALIGKMNSKSMIAVTISQLSDAIVLSGISREHPINALAIDQELQIALEDAAFGNGDAVMRVIARRGSRTISKNDLAGARAQNDRIGREGESLINFMLQEQLRSQQIASYEWASEINAASPHDFRVVTLQGETVKIEVKTTSGPFERDMHMSASELADAAQGPEKYDLYRVYSLTEDGANVAISHNIQNFSKNILSNLKLPAGIRCDSFSISPQIRDFKWVNAGHIDRPIEDEG